MFVKKSVNKLNVKLKYSNTLKTHFNTLCLYLNTQAVRHFINTSPASKLLLMRAKKMEITGHEIGSVGYSGPKYPGRKDITSNDLNLAY